MPVQNSSPTIWCRRLILPGVIVLLVTAVVVVVVLAVINPEQKTTTGTLRWKGKGTTPNLKEVILGRCYNYITIVNPELSSKDCHNIWMRLLSAFMYKHPCSMREEDYYPLMNMARHSIPCNKSLFWSKTNNLVHRYTKANHDFITLEDTLLGYIADDITWCGSSDLGINYNSCPKRNECESNPSSMYWKMASKMFAEAACGTVQVMLNGSIDNGAFRNDSIFGSVEILNLNPDKVSAVQVWLMHDIEGPQRPVQLLQCASNPNHATCRLCPYVTQ
ncbi:ADP-ribosyl cyclase/cyclic ADP-ribose hydrolase 1-like isoform X2 [Eublepharis macularius]|uniref:ADP-ribosyl cyclase/cyclic ADP-ribose hydrolase 1 n=1 Tax=Eublepharis macularius TaxID=481883 RepID=A0AA97KHX0_EUBMA|nr:ADP-ribosyl cyclase/cyclic ADP-ribose hydrolase 1-like isoform X2 [Eublepharis macularius]